jgi:hypothetical protein
MASHRIAISLVTNPDAHCVVHEAADSSGRKYVQSVELDRVFVRRVRAAFSALDRDNTTLDEITPKVMAAVQATETEVEFALDYLYRHRLISFEGFSELVSV